MPHTTVDELRREAQKAGLSEQQFQEVSAFSRRVARDIFERVADAIASNPLFSSNPLLLLTAMRAARVGVSVTLETLVNETPNAPTFGEEFAAA